MLAVAHKFLAPVIRLGARREHLHNQPWLALDLAAVGIGSAASDHHIGIKIAAVGVGLHLHIGHERATRRAAQMLAQGHIHIARDGDMAVFSTGHGKHLAIDKLMALGLRSLPGQIVLGTQVV